MDLRFTQLPPAVTNILETDNFAVQSTKILKTDEITKLLLEATPMACHIWNQKIEMFECNEGNVRLFNLQHKHELLGNALAFMPPYQPDGQLSVRRAIGFIKQAFDEGKCVTEFTLQTSDGIPIPSEVTLVRVTLVDEDVVVGYIRDLREHQRIMDRLQQRDNLLNAVNTAANVLLSEGNEETFDSSLHSGMELIGRCVDADRIYILHSELIDDEEHYVVKYEWFSERGKQEPRMKVGAKYSHKSIREWSIDFSNGVCLNGPLSSFSPRLQQLFGRMKIRSLLVIPIFIQDSFWGLISFSDLTKDRFFAEEEIKILRSGALMMTNAINRNTQASEIREIHKRASLLLDSTPVGANLWDKALHIFDCNEESVKQFGLKDKEEFLTRFFDLSPKYQPDGSLSKLSVYNNIRKAFAEGRLVFEWMHQKPDGTPLPMNVTLVRIPYENDYVVAGYCRDLSEEKAIMRKIEKRDYLMNTVNRAAGILLQSGIDDFAKDLHRCMGMFAEAVGVDRISIYRNHALNYQHCYKLVFEWFGAGSAVGMCSVEAFYPENLAVCDREVVPSWESVLTGGDCINSLVLDMPLHERNSFIDQGVLAVFVTPVFIRDKYWGFVSYDNYHEERIFSENEQIIMRSGSLVIANALLQNEMMQNLHTAAEQLEEALKDAQMANSAKSDFLAKMSHEMRTPLTAIIGLSELNLEKVGLDWDTYANLEKINNAGVTLMKTVNDILDLSKIEAGMMELVPVDYDVTSLINDTITQNILRIGEKPISLHLEMGADIFANLHGDELRVKQIMNNLLSNAIKYTDVGEVELDVQCVREDDNVWLTIRVSDTGKGILSQDIDKLFDNFAQMDLNLNRRIEGTGLGLPITKKLVDLMKGELTVISEYGKGSIFTAKVLQKYVSDNYISPDVVENLRSFRYSDRRRNQNRRLKRISLPYARVLVVDDNLANLDVIKGLMKPYGMQIDCVTDGRQAVEVIKNENTKYNAVFMDHMMPYMDGIEATQTIRALGTDYARNIPIIAVTANAIAGNEELFLSKGFQAFLTKPIDLARLDEAIRHWVRDPEQEKLYAECRLATEGELPPFLSGTADEPECVEGDGGFDYRKMEFVGLDIGKGVERFGGDLDTYLNSLRSFAVHTRPLLQLVEEVSKETLADYIITIHGIKGSSRGIMAESLGTAAEKLEKAARAGDFAYILKHNHAFLDKAWRLIHDLDDMFTAMEAQNPKPITDKPAVESLAQVLSACTAYDIDSVEEVLAEMEKYQYTADDGLVAWLRENVRLSNFKEIRERLLGMLE